MSATGSGPADPKVSVAMITYNHQAFIAQAIEGVLMQQTGFKVELVIGDDCSSDGTRAIVGDYSRRYPEFIRPLLHERNLGLSGKNNTAATVKACRGQYIALCDGDDYWTSPLKLQKQVDFLDAHADCAICYHNVTVVYDDGAHARRNFLSPGQKPFATLADMVVDDLIPTCSAMLRSRLIAEEPPWFSKTIMGDWPLFVRVLGVENGRAAYLDEVMAVYRQHAGGIWSAMPRKQQLANVITFYEAITTVPDIPAASRASVLGRVCWMRGLYHAEAAESAAAALDFDKAAMEFALLDAEPEFATRRLVCVDDNVRPVAQFRQLLALLPSRYKEIRRFKRLAWAEYHMVSCFAAHRDRDAGVVRLHLLPAFWGNPRYLRERGLWSVAAEGFLGAATAKWLRRHTRSLRTSRLSSPASRGPAQA